MTDHSQKNRGRKLVNVAAEQNILAKFEIKKLNIVADFIGDLDDILNSKSKT